MLAILIDVYHLLFNKKANGLLLEQGKTTAKLTKKES